MYTVKWSVLQYTIVRPAASIAGIICQAFNVLCEQSWSPKYASVWLTAIDFISISVALYGLLLFYGLTKEELAGRRPLAKFLCIKLIVFFTFYQSFVFSALQHYGVIKATEFWTESNVADGLNALVTTIEMVIFAVFMMWAYPSHEYARAGGNRQSSWKAIIDSINFSDFGWEIYTSLRFFVDAALGKPYTRTQKDQLEGGKVDFERAFLYPAKYSLDEMPVVPHSSRNALTGDHVDPAYANQEVTRPELMPLHHSLR
ncbi:hypothetical protein FRC03_012527 [Tulasnella sp. 419]|nr:hypothetical protein FRC03_012527 [Tulasnella sp. 419]